MFSGRTQVNECETMEDENSVNHNKTYLAYLIVYLVVNKQRNKCYIHTWWSNIKQFPIIETKWMFDVQLNGFPFHKIVNILG